MRQFIFLSAGVALLSAGLLGCPRNPPSTPVPKTVQQGDVDERSQRGDDAVDRSQEKVDQDQRENRREDRKKEEKTQEQKKP